MVGVKKEGKMNYNLEQEIEEIVDRQLQDLGFIDLCTRIAQKVVERVQKIDEEHSIIKTELTDIEEKLNLIFADKKPPDSKVQVVKRNVIVIDEEDEKPLLEKLQELSKSSQNLSCSGDIASSKAQTDFQRDQVRSKNQLGHGEIVSRDSNVVKNEKTSIGAKRTSSINGSDIQSSSFESVGPKRLALSNNLSEPQVTSSSSQTFKRTTAGTESKVNSSITFINRNLYRSPPKDPAGKIASLSFTSLKTSNKNEQDQAKPIISESSSSVAKNSKSTSERLSEGSNSPSSVDKSVVVKSSASVEETDEQERGLQQETTDEYDFADEGYEFKEGDSVLGKPEKSDIWYTAKITRIIATKYGQKKFQVKFDSGQRMHGTLPGNSLAPIAHPKGSSLNVGSRVVAIRPRDTVDARIQKKYMTLNSLVMAKGEILYGGVVVERACEDNRNRFLVFFDDGFAQYMTEKKMHLVIHSAENVWQDVSIHCREFIKEYLEEFPERPMLKLKAGLCVQTEWNGKWLQAKVVAVDCSLVKMLFDVDKRTEWIYRGSTRLEPLYSELGRRDLEALKNKGKKSSKKKKSVASNMKKVEPYVEDAITKPCFGISRFSKTDPQGIQQIKEWGPVEEKSSSASMEQDEKSLYVSADNEGGSPTSGGKVGSDSGKNNQTLSKKRKMDNLSEHGSVSSVDANSPDNAAGSNRNPGSDAMINLPSPKNPRQGTAKTFQRHSSQSSIESTASDSQLLLRNSNQGRFERQLSSQSLQSESLNSKSLGTGFVRHSSSGALGSETRVNFSGNGSPSVPVTRSKSMAQLFSSPERSVDAQLIAKRRSSSQEKLLQPFASVTRQRMILPRPPQQQMQYLKLAQSSAGQATKVLVPIVGHIGATQSPTTSTHMVALINLTQSFPKIRGPHQCSTKCIPEVYLPQSERKRHNPLSVPLLLGWTRETAKRRPGYHRDIYYRAPCSKRLRNLSEVTKYLLQTKATNVTIDEFSFDASISCRDQIPIFKTPRLKIDDISNGMEKIPISCVNERNDELPPNVEYISERIIGLGIDMNHDSGFLASCDCQDNCQDRTKCACARLTIDSSDAINGKKDEHCGYQYRRLREGVTTGIYECGRNCSCSATCYNKVVQNGIGVRLQVFMTEDKGWGLRCLDDIPRGTFICTYSGQILNEEMADKEGKDFGDEYLAELDHIEVVEQAKEGYESDVPELRQEKKTERSLSFESSNKEYDSDSDESEFGYISTSESSDSLDSNKSITKETNTPSFQQPSNRPTTNTPSKVTSDDVIDLTLESDPENEAETSKRLLGSLKEEGISTPSSLDQMIHRLKTGVDCNGKMIDRLVALRQTVTQKQKSQESQESPSKADSTENLEKDEKSEGESPKIKLKFEIGGESPDADLKPETEAGIETGERLEEAKLTVKIDWNDEVKKAIETIGPKIRKAVARKSTRSILFQKLSKDERNKPEPRVLENVAKNDVSQAFVSGKTFTSPRSSTGGHFARKSTSHRIQITPPGQRPQQTQNEPQQEQDVATDNKEAEKKSTRLLFGEDQCYVIDAKSFGNVGRYLNHSCMPNLFVQNVFYDTHDLRFPLVAFFTQQNVPALTELTWDYSYEVGSVPGKVLQCYCGSIECRGRLL